VDRHAIRKLVPRFGPLAGALFLGGFWGLWHAPVVDFLGAAYPHGEYWLPFFMAFIAAVMALRVLMVWIFSNTGGSTLAAHITHISFTGSLATLAPTSVSAAMETGWYAIFAALLWLLVLAVVLT
jgi:hypothetical protein